MYKRFQVFFKWLGFLALLASLVLVVWLFRLGILNDQNAFKQWVSQYKFIAPLLFIIIQIVQIVIPIIPGGVTTVAGTLVFGAVRGLIYNYIGIIIGSLALFHLVKCYGRQFILLFISQEKFFVYERHLESKTYERLFIFSMASPVSPADIMVMITGLTDMSYRRFLSIILWTKPFSILGYSYLWIYGGKMFQQLLHWLTIK